MSDTDRLREFALTFKRFLDDVIESLPRAPSHFEKILAAHFENAKADAFPLIVSASLEWHAHADVQTALARSREVCSARRR